MFRSAHRPAWLVLLAVLALAFGAASIREPAPSLAQQPTPAPTEVPVLGKIEAEKACYVRLPDLPPTVNRSGRYGMFGAYNPRTGILAAAGGAHKMSDENTIAYHDLLALSLTGQPSNWREVPYSTSTGYTQDTDRGCREMTSVQVHEALWLSVFGKDGCDNGRFDTSKKAGGDIKALQVLDSASASGVKWVPNSGAAELIGELAANKGKLTRLFAVWDTKRGRLVFGQGTFDDEKDSASQDRIYEGRPSGNQYQLAELRPKGAGPIKRFGACAAYVNDPDNGLDGILILGGQQGAPEGIPATTYKEVWWLDFRANRNGEWFNITNRFANMDAFGFRREGACAYDPETKYFYSWMGRADKSIPDGASHSSGAWRVNLAPLGQPDAPLTWERLAKDNLKGVLGRRLIPSVWDPVNKRMFVIGGRNGNDGLRDVWAIYPDVTGSQCQNLNPFGAAPQPQPTAPRPTAPAPTSPAPGPTVAPQPTSVVPQACDFILDKVPAQVINDALANPNRIQGYGQLQNPGVPEGPWNQRRSRLSLQNISAPYHPLYNGLIFKAGCP